MRILTYMTKLISLLLIAAAVLIGGAVWTQQQDTPVSVQPVWEDTAVEDFMSPLAELREEITPPPLRGVLTGSGGPLTAAGVLSETNRHRAIDGLPALTANATLDAAAQNKLDDMFARQYFDHVSPTGEGPADVVTDVNYQYIRVGENLALGNFDDDTDLVQAWMDSPGHRENILKQGFDEIGIAVGRGRFDGHTTWLAVQTFAKPLSACPDVDTGLQKKFETTLAQYDAANAQLESRRAEIDRERTIISDLLAEVNNLIDAGNAEIARGNEIAEETQSEEEARPHWEKGEALHAEAQTKRAELNTRNAAFDVQVDEFNTQVDTQQTVNQTLAELADTINGQVRAYNACLEE